jgi:hypothetical protein
MALATLGVGPAQLRAYRNWYGYGWRQYFQPSYATSYGFYVPALVQVSVPVQVQVLVPVQVAVLVPTAVPVAVPVQTAVPMAVPVQQAAQ